MYSQWVRLILAAGLALKAGSNSELCAQSPDRAWNEDATLRDVAFHDQKIGWAAGDRGTIWYTNDSGRHWRLGASGTDAALESLSFGDARHGWAVGGGQTPFAEISTGVVLYTTDGGRTWRHDPRLAIPALSSVRFFSAAQGLALSQSLGGRSGMVWSTDDGGRSWTPSPGEASGDWHAAHFLSPFDGVLASMDGAMALVERRRPRTTDRVQDSRPLRRVCMGSDGVGWLVGDGGLILRTTDGALTWTKAQAPACSGDGAVFDWRAVASHGNHAWIAGSPGSVVLKTSDAGQTWTEAATGQSLPIHDLEFVNAERGWAVGALGTILATEDGGRSWRVQRSGGKRLALLGLFKDQESTPLLLYAKAAGNDGYLSGACLLTECSRDPGQASFSEMEERARWAIVNVGGAVAYQAWGFPTRQSALGISGQTIVAGWNRTYPEGGLARLEEYALTQILTWRPDVVVTQAAAPRDAHGVDHAINQAVLRAVERAGDATDWTPALRRARLEPWSVGKVFGVMREGRGDINISPAQYAPRLGRSLGDVASAAAALATGQEPGSVGLTLHIDRVPQGLGARDVFSGIESSAGDNRRPFEATQTLAGAPATALARRNAAGILRHLVSAKGDGARFMAQINDLVGGLPAPEAGEVLHQLAGQYVRSGDWELADETYGLLAERFPDHLLAPAALLWQLQYRASAEAQFRARRRATGMPDLSAIVANLGTRETPAGSDSTTSPNPSGSSRLSAWDVMTRLERLAPAARLDPRVRFGLAAAQRRNGLPGQAETIYREWNAFHPRDAWWLRAAGELWLAGGPAPEPPVVLRRALRAKSRPRLDGRLDEPMWQDAAPLELSSALGDDGSWPAMALVAWDADCLYLAAQCAVPSIRRGPSAQEARKRDPDQARLDRIAFCLDVDRDACTAYELVFDEHGGVGDACWGDRSWNPKLFVASMISDGMWTSEAAIPWTELVETPPGGQDAWALSVQRVVPGTGFQSWTQPAAVQTRLEGAGMLMFGSGTAGDAADAPSVARSESLPGAGETLASPPQEALR